MNTAQELKTQRARLIALRQAELEAARRLEKAIRQISLVLAKGEATAAKYAA